LQRLDEPLLQSGFIVFKALCKPPYYCPKAFSLSHEDHVGRAKAFGFGSLDQQII
jgi:hypothetical protein